MSTRVELTGKASAEAQSLVEALDDAGFDVGEAAGVDQSRDLPTLAHELAVGLFVHGTYDAVRAVVLQWVSKMGLPPDDASVESTDDEDDGSDSG